MRTFGIEIEFFTTMPWYDRHSSQNINVQNYSTYKSDKEIIRHITDFCGKIPIKDAKPNWLTSWLLKSDASVSGDGRELISPPLPFNETSCLQVCSVLSALKEIAFVDKTCGLHVHVGAQDLFFNQFLKALLAWTAFKEETNTFLPPHRRDNRFCRHLDHNILQQFFQARDFLSIPSGHGRYFHINPMAYAKHKTLEFRGLEGTLDQDVVCAWIATVVGFVENIAKESNQIYNENLNENIIIFQAEKKKQEYFNIINSLLSELEHIINRIENPTTLEKSKEKFEFLKKIALMEKKVVITNSMSELALIQTYIGALRNIYYYDTVTKTFIMTDKTFKELTVDKNTDYKVLIQTLFTYYKAFEFLWTTSLKNEMNEVITFEIIGSMARKYQKYGETIVENYSFDTMFTAKILEIFKNKNPHLNPFSSLDKNMLEIIQERKKMFEI